ncbi:unnamed protein product, partial [Nippostrongylus brasiliensis]|uniref:VTC domain-containing protein n=1 Tax=Nippostrongylus brasiliensis TaxID=27835 RepID=A0A0N4YWA1_NIPBR
MTYNEANSNMKWKKEYEFLLVKKLRLKVADRSEGSAAMRELSCLLENTDKIRFPVEVQIKYDLYIPVNSEIAELREDDRCYLRLKAGDVPYSRVVVRGTVYSSSIYWKRQSSSQQDMVVLNEYETCSPFEDLGNRVNHFQHPQRRSPLQLMRLISEHNCFFKQALSCRARRQKMYKPRALKGSTRSTPYQRGTVLSRHQLPPTRCHQSCDNDISLESDIPICEQQEIPPGNIAIGREFVMEPPPSQSPVRTPTMLAECLENNVLDMLRAS